MIWPESGRITSRKRSLIIGTREHWLTRSEPISPGRQHAGHGLRICEAGARVPPSAQPKPQVRVLVPEVSVGRDRYADALPGGCVPRDFAAALASRWTPMESRNLLPCGAGLITAARWPGNPPRR